MIALRTIEHFGDRGQAWGSRDALIICPVCNSGAGIRSSQWETPLVKTIHAACRNIGCGMTFKMQLSFVYVISPSGIDAPHLDLPQCPPEYIRHRFPRGAREPGNDPGDPDQLPMFPETGAF